MTRSQQDDPESSGKRPAFQFYPGDEDRDSSLRIVGLAAFGLWHRMLNLMHFGNPRGHLVTTGGKPIDLAQLARLVGESPTVIAKHLDALESERVFSRTPGGTIYCRRMVRDERLRTVRADAGRLGGEANLLKQTAEQIAEQSTPPAVAAAAAAAAAVASPDAKSGAEKQRWATFASASAATATAPPACWSDLEGKRLQLLITCYGDAPPNVQRDKGEQMRALLSPEGAKWGRRNQAQRVQAGSLERLERKCAETLDELHRLRDRKAAMAYLLRKVADTSDNTMPAQLAEAQAQRERQHVEITSEADYALAESWASNHADVLTAFENLCRRENWGDNPSMRQQMRRAHVLDSWRRKGAPGAPQTELGAR